MLIKVVYEDVALDLYAKTATPCRTTMRFTQFTTLRECVEAIKAQGGAYGPDVFIPWHKIAKISEVKHV